MKADDRGNIHTVSGGGGNTHIFYFSKRVSAMFLSLPKDPNLGVFIVIVAAGKGGTNLYYLLGSLI